MASVVIVCLMLEVWLCSGIGAQGHKRETEINPGLGYRGPTSSSGLFFLFKSTKLGGGGVQMSLAEDRSVPSYGSSMVWFLPR